MSKFFNWRWLPILLYAVVSFVIYLPSFKLNFSLLDDGLSIVNAKLVLKYLANYDFNSLLSVILEPDVGRVRPGYWLVQSIFVYLSFYNSQISHVLRFGLLLATSFAVYKLLQKLGIRIGIITFSLFVFLLNIQNFENYYRLGPVEPYITFILVIIYYLIFVVKVWNKKHVILITTLIILGGFIKENFFLIGISLVPAFLLSKIQNNKFLFIKTFLSIVSLAIVGSTVFIIKSNYPSAGVYASNYILETSKITTNFFEYIKMIDFYQSPIFWISLLYFVYLPIEILIKGIRNISDKEILYVTLWLQVLVQLIALSPWTFVLDRYLAFININLVLIYALTLSDLLQKFKEWQKRLSSSKINLIFTVLLIIIFLRPFVRSFFKIANQQLLAHTDSEISYKSVAEIAYKVPRNSVVYVNYLKGDVNIEIYEETKIHLELFHNRGDILFKYLDESNLCTKEDRYIFDRRSGRFLDKDVFKDAEKFYPIASGKSVYSPINYGQVIRSFRDRQKYKAWSDDYDFDWNIYIQKGGTCIEGKS